MSKIKIKSSLKSKNENYEYSGMAIKNKNVIMYNDSNIMTKITIDNIITIERRKDYFLKLNLKKGINLEGEYITKYGNLKVNTFTKEILNDDKSLKIVYDLHIDDEFIDTFEYILEYSIDRH